MEFPVTALQLTPFRSWRVELNYELPVELFKFALIVT